MDTSLSDYRNVLVWVAVSVRGCVCVSSDSWSLDLSDLSIKEHKGWPQIWCSCSNEDSVVNSGVGSGIKLCPIYKIWWKVTKYMFLSTIFANVCTILNFTLLYSSTRPVTGWNLAQYSQLQLEVTVQNMILHKYVSILLNYCLHIYASVIKHNLQ